MALRRIADGRFHNTTTVALTQLQNAGLIDEDAKLTALGAEKALYASVCQMRRRERTTHTGGLSLPARWLDKKSMR